ncbi:unnamed protein product [Calypogeia fissa]
MMQLRTCSPTDQLRTKPPAANEIFPKETLNSGRSSLRRLVKLKFQDDSEKVEFMVIPQRQRKKLGLAFQEDREYDNLCSSGKLSSGGKHWRINSELGKMITARLGMKKIATRQQICSKPKSQVDPPDQLQK